MPETQDELLDALRTRGCTVKQVETTTLISLPEDYDEFVYERLGGWLYLGTTLYAPDDIDDSEHLGRLEHFLLILQHRNLGCRFSYDSAGYLTIGAELYPEQQKIDDVLEILDQMAFVLDVCVPFCDHVLSTGEIPSDREVDEAFGLGERLH